MRFTLVVTIWVWPHNWAPHFWDPPWYFSQHAQCVPAHPHCHYSLFVIYLMQCLTYYVHTLLYIIHCNQWSATIPRPINKSGNLNPLPCYRAKIHAHHADSSCMYYISITYSFLFLIMWCVNSYRNAPNINHAIYLYLVQWTVLGRQLVSQRKCIAIPFSPWSSTRKCNRKCGQK